MPDFWLGNHGTIYILTPKTEEAKKWVAKNLEQEGFILSTRGLPPPEERQTWAGGIVVEHRYIQPILEGIIRDKLTVEEA